MQGHRILIADDEPDIADVVSAVAEDIGYEVTVVHQGDEVVSRVSAVNPGTIVLDLRMPGADGVEILTELAELGCRAHIVLISGLDQRTLNSVEALGTDKNLNIVGSLTKPMYPDDIETLLKPLYAPPAGRGPAATTQHVNSKVSYGPAIGLLPYQDNRQAEQSAYRVELRPRWLLDNGEELSDQALFDWSHETGIAKGLIETTLRQGLAQRAGLGEAGEDVDVILELGPGLLRNASVANQMADIVEEFGLSAERLTLKTSGQGVQQLQADSIEVLSRLRIKGFRIAFVTASSSDDDLLSLIDKLPLDELMVDMTPLADKKDLDSDMECEFSYSSLCSVARKKGVVTCASMISSKLQYDFARRCNFDWLSGPSISERLALGEMQRIVR